MFFKSTMFSKGLLVVFCWLSLCRISISQGQNYLFGHQPNAPYNPFQHDHNQFIDPSEIIPFRQTPAGFQHIDPSSEYLHSTDLQTSDLPSHLQQTLPQYRYTTSAPQALNFHSNQYSYQPAPPSSPAAFRPSHYLKPTTLRPNYSHLFSRAHSHIRDPSQTETFLGQITLQNADEDVPQQFDPKGLVDDSGSNAIGVKDRNRFLNHRTRIIAPDPSKETVRPKSNDYFVNNDGEVYATTEASKSTTKDRQKLPETTFNFNNYRNKKEYISKSTHQKSTDLEPLLEEPLKDNFGTNNDDEVEVIQSKDKEIKDERFEHVSNVSASHEDDLNHDDYEEEEVNTHAPDSNEYYTDEEEESVENSNDIHSAHLHETDEREGTKLENIKQDQKTSDSNTTTHEITTSKPTKSVTNVTVSKAAVVNMNESKEEKPEEPEVVVSIVTSKTVINNTVVASVTPNPATTTEIKSSTPSLDDMMENTTDTWVVVASVQTSRSVSGARYLPSSVVEQDVRVKLLNELPNSEEAKSDTFSSTTVTPESSSFKTELKETTLEQDDESDEESTTEITTMKLKTSTESLIDKLDQVQSDLSSGLLTGGLDNNIAVIKDPTPDKIDMSTMEDIKLTTSSTTKAPYPQVHIRKYSPANRPTTTRRPRTKPTKKFDLNRPQGDQPQDITSFLPPGYRLNASDDRSSKLLEEILNRVKPKKVDNVKDRQNKLGEGPIANATTKIESTSESSTSSSTTESSIFKNSNTVDITKFLPPGYKLSKDNNENDNKTTNDTTQSKTEEITEASIDKHTKLDDISKFLPPGFKQPSEEKTTESSIYKHTKADDVSKFLPPGYKLSKSEERTTESSIYKHTKLDDISKFLPPGFKQSKTDERTESSVYKHTKLDDISKFLPPGYKQSKSEERTTESGIFKHTKVDDVSKFLPPGFKIPKYKQDATTEASIFKHTKADDVSKFLPPGYKLPKTTTEKTDNKEINKDALPIDISALLPTGYKPSENSSESVNVPPNLLPPGFQANGSDSTTSKPGGGFKVVFPSRPGGNRKSVTRTTPKSLNDEPIKNTPPTIHKGWPSRATTEFTGWPTPSTTPISIEKLLEAARTASTSTTSSPETTTSTTVSTTTTPTTTTARPTTPGVCVDECDLYGTIKLVGGVKWAPELLDRNTKEWQVLANEVESQLDYVYSTSSLLNKWYKKIRIDGFSEGSVLVDYLVELNDVGRKVNTQEIKKLFHESLDDALLTFGASNREGKSLNESMKLEGKLSLGNFIVDPAYTDFLVLPKQTYPTVGIASDDVLLPQWAIAVIVIGLASLLFVIIFGVTVLVNRQKNSKKKSPTPLTEDMLNELNKNHMGGFDNYGADDLYNMEDVWNERSYDQKPQKKRSSGSIHDNSMSNLYDSWRSEWNGYYYNNYYGNNPGSSHSGYTGRRRSDYDTNF